MSFGNVAGALVIGTFRQEENGTFDGRLRTLGINTKVRIVPTIMRREQSVPPFRVLADRRQIGIAWRTLSDNCRRIDLIVKFDDPYFPAPVVASLAEAEDGTYTLVWIRGSEIEVQ